MSGSVKVDMLVELTRPMAFSLFAGPDNPVGLIEGGVIAEPTFPTGTRVLLHEIDTNNDDDNILGCSVWGITNTYRYLSWSDVTPVK